ncbi:MAG: aconitase X catalytic domain-containing protein, partial [Candidatus Bathyarchaeia archaeon]
MYLTREEERIYDGEHGWAYQVSMKILVRLGDLFGATKLIPIKSAHISGVSYKTLGDAPIDFLDTLASAGAKAQVPSTLNPSSFDTDYLAKNFPQEYRAQQLSIIDLYKKMDVRPVFTCTPYYIRKPQPDSHLAWAESSAAVYANSVLGSWTNREGGPSALAAALIGKTPNYGVHQAENRRADVLVKFEVSPRNQMEFGALGVHVGKLLKDKIPVFEGLSNYTNDDLKQLGAGLASSGMSTMFHYKEPPAERKLETVSIEAKDIENTIESLSTTWEAPDLIFIGCPHCSLNEVRNVAQALKGKKVREDAKLWVCTSRHVKGKAEKYVKIIEKAGGHVLCDTCAVVTWINKLGIDVMMTNSAKTAYYAP